MSASVRLKPTTVKQGACQSTEFPFMKSNAWSWKLRRLASGERKERLVNGRIPLVGDQIFQARQILFLGAGELAEL